VVLRNTPTLTNEDVSWLGNLSRFELSQDDVRALLEARRHGRIDNARLREMTGLDTLAASLVLRKLRDAGLLEMHPAGAQTYWMLGAEALASDVRHASAGPHQEGLDADRGARRGTAIRQGGVGRG
jgi:ATP-dependent DNA helicase RecG